MDERGKYLRRLSLRCLRGGNRGHLGSTLSLIEIMRVLYDDVANHGTKANPERDRIILSKGHGCIAQYVLLVDKGYFPIEELDKFCRKDGILGGHPSHKVSGIECDTGSLGHGLSIGVGMAIAAKIRKQKHRIFVVMGDGEIQEGSVWEAAMCAAKHKLDNLTILIDYNKIQSAGMVDDICPLEPLGTKLRAFGFAVSECNGHDIISLRDHLKYLTIMPHCIIANTIKGKGIPVAESNPAYHHKAQMSETELAEWEACLD